MAQYGRDRRVGGGPGGEGGGVWIFFLAFLAEGGLEKTELNVDGMERFLVERRSTVGINFSFLLGDFLGVGASSADLQSLANMANLFVIFRLRLLVYQLIYFCYV